MDQDTPWTANQNYKLSGESRLHASEIHFGNNQLTVESGSLDSVSDVFHSLGWVTGAASESGTRVDLHTGDFSAGTLKADFAVSGPKLGLNIRLEASRTMTLNRVVSNIYQGGGSYNNAFDLALQAPTLTIDSSSTPGKTAIELLGFGYQSAETSAGGWGIRAAINSQNLNIRGGGAYARQFCNSSAVYLKNGAVLDIGDLSGDGAALTITADPIETPADALFGNAAAYSDDYAKLNINYGTNAVLMFNGGLAVWGADSEISVRAGQGSTIALAGGPIGSVGYIEQSEQGLTLLPANIVIETAGKALIGTADEPTRIFAGNGSVTLKAGDGSKVYAALETNPTLVDPETVPGLREQASINADLSGAASVLSGAAVMHGATAGSTIAVTLEDGATWELNRFNAQRSSVETTEPIDTADLAHSQVSTLVMNDGVLNLQHSESTVQTLTIGSLSGTGGVIGMRAEMTEADASHDFIDIGEAAAGTYLVHVVAASGNEPTLETMTERLIHVGDPAEGVIFKESGADALPLGLYYYDYRLADREAADGGREWYLELDKTSELTPGGSAAAALAGMGAQAAMNAALLGDLRERLGDVRMQGDGALGVWASTGYQRDEIDGFAGQGYDQDAYRFNLGVDGRFGNWIAGANLRAVTADQDAGAAEGDAQSQGIQLYAVRTWDNGAYLDATLSADRYDVDITVVDAALGRTIGGYHAWGFGASAEIGHLLTFGASDRWFAEPQLQLPYYRIGGEDFSLSSGMTVSQDNYESLTARAGLAAGRLFLDAQGRRMGEFHVRAGVNHDFTGEKEIAINGTPFEDECLGTRFYYGVGGDWQVSDALRLYGMIEREEGSEYTKEIEAQVGVRFVF